MEGLEKDTQKIKYFLMKTLRTTRATTCRTFSILLLRVTTLSIEVFIKMALGLLIFWIMTQHYYIQENSIWQNYFLDYDT
jgi:hypothetical protein